MVPKVLPEIKTLKAKLERGAGETEETAELKGKKETGGKTLTTPGKEKLTENKQDGDATTAQQQSGVSPKLFSPFFEVRS